MNNNKKFRSLNRFSKKKQSFNTKEYLILKEILAKKQNEKDFPHHWYSLLFKKWKIDPIAILIAAMISNSLQTFWISYCVLLIIIHVPFEIIRARKIVNNKKK
jgi:hypothetical protein